MEICLGSIFLALTTRTWLTSLSIALMITVCYSNQTACRYSWIYHAYGWIFPLGVSMIIYLYSLNRDFKEISSVKFGRIQIILSMILLTMGILINTINLLRIARRTYRLKHRKQSTSVGRPLIDEEERNEDPIIPSNDHQLFRHGILVVLLTIDAIIVRISLEEFIERSIPSSVYLYYFGCYYPNIEMVFITNFNFSIRCFFMVK